MRKHNPVQVLDIPKVGRREVTPLELDQCKQLFAKCEYHRLGDIVPLAVLTGLRRGALRALEWADINLSEGVLSVRRTLEQRADGLSLKPPKSKAGRRAVDLDPLAVQALRNRRQKAIGDSMQRRLRSSTLPT